MKIASAIRTALIAPLVLVGLSSASFADIGTVRLTIYKAGWIIGGSGGSGILYFRGRAYPLSTGGLDYGLVFGGSKTVLHGTVRNISRPSDVAGGYGAAGAGGAGGGGGPAGAAAAPGGGGGGGGGRASGAVGDGGVRGGGKPGEKNAG